jgi:uncharacterized protein
MFKKINKTKLFYILVAIISLLSASLFYLLGGKLNTNAGLALASFYMFIPTISVLIIEKLIYKNSIRKKLFISFKLNKWFLIAWLIPPVLSILSIIIALSFSGVSFSPNMEGMFERYSNLLSTEQIMEMKDSFNEMPFHPFWLVLIQGLIAGITINALFGFGEELGWRAYLLRRFNNRNFLKASFIIGLVWGVWHAPIILMGHNYPSYPIFGVLMMTIWCILLSPLFLYITIKSKSVITASVMHGTLNATAGLSLIILKGGNELLIGVTGLAGFLALIFITSLFFFYDKYISKEKIMFKSISLN